MEKSVSILALDRVKKKKAVFVPDARIFVLVGNAIYSTRREEEGYQGFTDLPAVYNDLENMKKGLKRALGAQDSEIMEMKDIDFAKLSATMINLNERIIANWVTGSKQTLVLFYYAGHGIMKNYTSIVCDKAPRQNRIFFPLEK